MFDAGAHLGEEAELYALGELTPEQSAELERHVATCGDCARRVGEAEEAVAGLIEAQTAPDFSSRLARGRRPSIAPWIGSIAAAFVLGLVPWLLTMSRPTTVASVTTAPDVAAQTAMLHSHFLHVQIGSLAKVIYARDGRWIYVLAAPGDEPLTVIVSGCGRAGTTAWLKPSGSTRSVFLPMSCRAESVGFVIGQSAPGSTAASKREIVRPVRLAY